MRLLAMADDYRAKAGASEPNDAGASEPGDSDAELLPPHMAGSQDLPNGEGDRE